MKFKLLSLFIICSLNLFVVGCQGTKSTTTNIPTETQTSVKPNTRKNISNNLTTKVKFKRENGTEIFSLKPKANGIKVENAEGQEIARLTVDENRKIKIKNPADETLGYVVSKNGYWKLENFDSSKELYILRKQAEGDYKLESAENQQHLRECPYSQS